MQTTRRRTLLALGSSVAGATLAGCVSGDGGDDPDEVTVREVAVQPEVMWLNDDAYEVYGGREEAFVGAEVAVVPSATHPTGEFAVETPDGRYGAMTGRESGLNASFGDRYDQSEESGWVVARVPKPLGADRAALTWDGGEHALEEPTLERLNRPPASFDVAFEAPATATVGEELVATVTVENVVDIDGTFVGALNRVGPDVAYAPAAEIVLEIAAGERATWEFTHEIRDPGTEDGVPPMRLHLRWRGGERLTREIELDRP